MSSHQQYLNDLCHEDKDDPDSANMCINVSGKNDNEGNSGKDKREDDGKVLSQGRLTGEQTSTIAHDEEDQDQDEGFREGEDKED